jgi:hypothetical protein
MSHRAVIINSQTPPSAAHITSDDELTYQCSVEYRPGDSLTPAQIGQEVSRIQRLLNKIIGGED